MILSVALPVRNGENFLSEALDSILSQSYTDFKLVVSDNNSDDATPEILESYARRDKRILVYRSDRFLSLPRNMNRAIKLSPGKWIKMICHDDLMDVECLFSIANLIPEAESRNVGLIGNGEKHLYANGYVREPGNAGAVSWWSGRDAAIASFNGRPGFGLAAVTTATVKKPAFDRIGGFDERFAHFDIFCWLKMFSLYDYAYIPTPLTTNRIHYGQVAVKARASLRTVEDFKTFMPEYVGKEAKTLDLPYRIRLRARIRPLGEAATAMGGEIAKGHWRSAFAMVNRVPARWLPILAPLIVRASFRWRRRAKELELFVPPGILP